MREEESLKEERNVDLPQVQSDPKFNHRWHVSTEINSKNAEFSPTVSVFFVFKSAICFSPIPVSEISLFAAVLAAFMDVLYITSIT